MSVYENGLTQSEFLSEMQAAGYSVQSAERAGKSIIIVSKTKSGLKFLVELLEPLAGRHVIAQFFMGFTHKPALGNVSRWNSEHRWPRVAVDRDGDMTLDMVFHLAGVSSFYVQGIFMWWDVAVQSVVDCDYL